MGAEIDKKASSFIQFVETEGFEDQLSSSADEEEEVESDTDFLDELDRMFGGEEAKKADEEKEFISPVDALGAIANEGENLLADMHKAALVHPATFDDFLNEMPLNRAPHLVCFDHTRVHIKDNFGDSDYIHASYVDGYSLKAHYIFAQAPFNKNTEDQFWRMVLGEKPAMILVFGDVVESHAKKDDFCYEIGQNGFEKAYFREYGVDRWEDVESKTHIGKIFWPSEMSDRKCFAKNDHITVSNVGVHRETHIDVNMLNIEEARMKPSSTTLIHFKDWTDETPLPEYLADMRAQVKIHMIRAQKKPSAFNGPMLLVCPTGVSRCGAYAVLDIVLQRLAEEHTVGIKESIMAIKSQRYGSFRNLQHYKTIREIVLRNAISSGVVHDTAIGDKAPSVRPKKKRTKKKPLTEALKKRMGK
ncbi:unnamed protein product [Caenorhabditis bovis]|uniref:Tyrosine-protein phosphatase domain-containing protein n=1 Tax=Caenorhabditis bovis TaxID=2654633 RepID=A0A8S1EE46_9PELO|nr:unnamed protein product [Caenorhabditis bovis]